MIKLSKEEMKKVIGGVEAPPPGGTCGSNQYWLVCTTPNGSEDWCRNSETGDASSACQAIYPAYGSAVSGNWAPVINIPTT